MATAYSTLYPYLRVLLGDSGTYPLYATSNLDAGITMAIMQERGTVTGDSGSGISPDLDVNGQLRIVLRAAISLLSPSSDKSMVRTPLGAHSHENSRMNGHLAWLEQQLQELLDETNVVTAYTDWNHYFRSIRNVPLSVSQLAASASVATPVVAT